MGVLDELKQEADAVAAAKARETTSRAEQLAQSRERVNPCVRSAFKYFSEFKQHLTVVDREILASYEIRDIGLVEELKQGQYSVSTEDAEKLDKFSFRCVCAKSGALQVNQGDVASVASYRDFLRGNGMQAKVRDAKGGGALFMVQPAIPVVVEFSGDYERSVVQLRLRNLNCIGVTRHSLTPDQVNEKLFDEIAKAILRQPNRFDELIGNAISQTGKLRIKKQLEAAMRQKQLEDELARREAASERTITKRLTRTLLGRDK